MEFVLGQELVYLVAGYVSPTRRVLRIEGSAEFALVEALEQPTGAVAEDSIVYFFGARGSNMNLFV